MPDIRTKKCGCIVFDVGDPVLCPKHAERATKRASREARLASREAKRERKAKVAEEKGLRKLVTEKAAELGHDLKRFQEYGAAGQPGKWTSYCANCGDLVIVYDELKHVPADSDQVIGKVLTERCRRSAIIAALREEDAA